MFADHNYQSLNLKLTRYFIEWNAISQPDDIADACLLLCSPLAGYVTGATLRVDGGGQLPAFTTIRRR